MTKNRPNVTFDLYPYIVSTALMIHTLAPTKRRITSKHNGHHDPGADAAGNPKPSISVIEAERLSVLSRRLMTPVKHPIRHSQEEFSGVPCPFLVDDKCSVYEARPYACRAHYSFDTSAYWCHPERSNKGEMSLLQMSGALQAYNEIVGSSPLRGFADIRDFFPS